MTASSRPSARPSAASAAPPFGRPPALVFLGDYYGTLATARTLGRRGIDVVLAESASHRLVRAQGSRYVKRRVTCPDIADVPAFVRWLTDFGRREPGHVLYAASDELVWIFAKYREQLAPYFKLTSPDLATTLRLLDKHKLHDACEAAGMSTPRTWYPQGEDEARALAPELPRPVLLKPRMQVQLASGSKGGKVDAGDDFVAKYTDYVRDNSFGAALVADDPDVVWPMVQEFLEAATHDIYSLSGFADGDRFVVRAAVKILQRPRKLGIGLCFESAPVDPRIAESLQRLCRQVGYRGVFEVEFVERKMLIDFNPRPYSQMAFESARGMPLPWLSYLLATGDEATLDSEIVRANAWSDPRSYVYAHGFLLGLVSTGQMLARTLRGAPDEHWPRWKHEHRGRYTDAVQDRDDPWPALIDVAEHARNFVKHPRSFLRSLSR